MLICSCARVHTYIHTHSQNCETCVCVCVCHRHHPTFPNVSYAVIQPLFVLKKNFDFCVKPLQLKVGGSECESSHCCETELKSFFLFCFFSSYSRKTHKPNLNPPTRHLSQQRSDCWAEATASKDVIFILDDKKTKKKTFSP